MIRSKKLLLITLLLFAISYSSNAQINLQYEAIPVSYNVNSANPVQALDVQYDSDDPGRQSFHIFLPDTTQPHSLVIFIHGGGFTGGSKDIVINSTTGQATIKYYLDRGVAFASIGYRLLSTTQQDAVGVKKSLFDSRRALQFIRHYAAELYIDPSKIALSGTSAGAGTSVWLATRNDMANSNAQDVIERESTRVCAVETSASQSTYDIYKWETEVYNDFDGQGTNFTIDSIVDVLSFQLASNFYGGLDSNYHFLYDPDLIQYRQDVDMLFHLSNDDPPLYIRNTSAAVHPSQDLYHHSLQGKTLMDGALAANLPEVKAEIAALSLNTTQGESGAEFLIRHLSSCALSTSVPLLKEDAQVSVYPNPSSDQLIIDARDNSDLTSVKLFNLSGQLLLERVFENTNRIQIATSSIDAGIYLLEIRDENRVLSVQKVVVE